MKLNALHWDILKLVRTLCYEGLPETKIARIDPDDRHLAKWEINPHRTRFVMPQGVPEPVVRACVSKVTFEESARRWGPGGAYLEPALQYLIDRELLVVAYGNAPVYAAFKNYFDDSEILSTVDIVENQNGRFYVWRTWGALSMLSNHNEWLVVNNGYRVFKLSERAQQLVDAELGAVPAKEEAKHESPTRTIEQLKSSSKERGGGRPRTSNAEISKRQKLVDEWSRAKSSGVKQKDFCNDRNITIKYLATCLNYFAQQHRRKTP